MLPVRHRSVQPHSAASFRSSRRSPSSDRFALASPDLRSAGPARPGPPTLRGHLRPPCRGLPHRDRHGLPLHTRGRRPTGRPRAHAATGHDDPVRKKAYVILDGTVLPIDRIAADQPYYSGKKKHHGMNVQVLADPAGRLIWASTAGSHTRPDRGPEPRHTRRPRRRRHQVLGRQGVPGRRPCAPCPDSWQAPPRLAPTPQRRSRQDSQPRRTRHGHTQVPAAPAEAPLQHPPDHSCRPCRRRPRTRHLIRMEKAQ